MQHVFQTGLYKYFNNTLILQFSNAHCFVALMHPAPLADSYVPVTSLLQRLLAHMYELSNNSHTCHTRQRQQLHLLIYKCRTPANTQSTYCYGHQRQRCRHVSAPSRRTTPRLNQHVAIVYNIQPIRRNTITMCHRVFDRLF